MTRGSYRSRRSGPMSRAEHNDSAFPTKAHRGNGERDRGPHTRRATMIASKIQNVPWALAPWPVHVHFLHPFPQVIVFPSCQSKLVTSRGRYAIEETMSAMDDLLCVLLRRQAAQEYSILARSLKSRFGFQYPAALSSLAREKREMSSS